MFIRAPDHTHLSSYWDDNFGTEEYRPSKSREKAFDYSAALDAVDQVAIDFGAAITFPDDDLTATPSYPSKEPEW